MNSAFLVISYVRTLSVSSSPSAWNHFFSAENKNGRLARATASTERIVKIARHSTARRRRFTPQRITNISFPLRLYLMLLDRLFKYFFTKAISRIFDIFKIQVIEKFLYFVIFYVKLSDNKS